MSKKEQLISAFIKGKVSRRDFSAGLATMGLSAPMVATVINESIATAEAAEPVSGGRLTVAYSSGSAADTIDPTKAVQDIDIARIQLLGSRLVDFRPGHGDEPLLPNLATEWEPNADATVWRFKLLKDAEFHNGKTITPVDVAYTVNRHKTEGSPQAPLLADVESVTTDGDYAVFNLSSGDADIAYLMSGYGMQIMPEGQGAEAYADGTAVGAGPFAVEEFEPGITAVFKRNSNYHKDGKPLLDEVETFSIPDNSSRVNALAAGDVDAIASVEANLVGQVERSDRIRILTQPGSAFGAYNMRCDTPPYDDVNVRTALKWAFDREKIVELGFNGHGVVARDNPIPSHDPFFCDEVPVPYADPDKVKGTSNNALLPED